MYNRYVTCFLASSLLFVSSRMDEMLIMLVRLVSRLVGLVRYRLGQGWCLLFHLERDVRYFLWCWMGAGVGKGIMAC